MVAVRQKKEIEYSPQQELLNVENYDYFCYATTENDTAWETHKRYGQRATSETWAEEAKGQLGLLIETLFGWIEEKTGIITC